METILVVEDEQYIRENLVDLLESEGYNVLSAENGESGYLSVKFNYPDLILSDIRMPKMDGLQFLNQLQKDPKTAPIPFIFLSAKVEMNEIREGMINGADDYITKPFKSEDVLLTVQSRLKKKKDRDFFVEQLRNTFIKNIPHELRTPLIGILGYSELIQNDFDSLSDDDIKDIARRINNSGRRLHRRIEKLIHLSYLLSIDLSSYNPKESIEIIPDIFLNIVNRTAEKYDRTCDVSAEFEHGLIYIEFEMVDTVMSELVENAIKFSSKGSPIKITGRHIGNQYIISLEDRGIGLNIKDISEINIFNKIDSNNENREGLGLGLAIVKRIMELSRGDIKFSKDKNGLSSVQVIFRSNNNTQQKK